MLRPFFLISGCLLVSSDAFAAAGSGAPNWNDLFFKITNFVLFFVLLHIAASKPIKGALSTALKKKAHAFGESRVKLDAARKEYKELKSKIDSLKEELEMMKKSSEKALQEERERILADAERHARKIIEQTDSRIEQQELKARDRIKKFIIEESIKQASSKESIKKLDQSSLIDRFQSKIESVES